MINGWLLASMGKGARTCLQPAEKLRAGRACRQGPSRRGLVHVGSTSATCWQVHMGTARGFGAFQILSRRATATMLGVIIPLKHQPVPTPMATPTQITSGIAG